MGCWRIWSCWDLMFKPQKIGAWKIMETGMETGWKLGWKMAHFDLDLWVVQKDHHLGPVEITKKMRFVRNKFMEEGSIKAYHETPAFPRWNLRTRDLISGNVKCCWWLKSCTSSYVVYPIIYRVLAPSQVVQDVFHQQYVKFPIDYGSQVLNMRQLQGYKCISRTMRIAPEELGLLFRIISAAPSNSSYLSNTISVRETCPGDKKLAPNSGRNDHFSLWKKENLPTSNSPQKNTFQTGGEQTP